MARCRDRRNAGHFNRSGIRFLRPHTQNSGYEAAQTLILTDRKKSFKSMAVDSGFQEAPAAVYICSSFEKSPGLVYEPCADYVPWQDDVPEIEV